MERAKADASPAEAKRITFAENARHWNHRATGGMASPTAGPASFNSDADMERQPEHLDDLAPGIVRDQSRLGGARALPNLKERGT